tara:strand:- start:1852 stop:3006 length:1155 start_codon:yes stop_codon:yes gene_type:complete
MSKKNILSLLFFGAVLLLGFWMLGVSNGENATPPPARAQTPVEVTVMALVQQPVNITEEYPGRTHAYKIAEIRPQATGIITERTFEEGSLVKKGQQLYQIDPATFKAALNQAKADLIKAEANHRAVKAKAGRYKELVKSNAISGQTYDDTIAALEEAAADIIVAKSAVSTAEISLDYTKIRAPISGRIGKSAITPGALVTANQPAALATITQLDPIYVDMTQSSRDLMSFRKLVQDTSSVKLDLLDEMGRPFYDQQGTLQFSEVNVNEGTGTIMLRALFANPDSQLLPGLFVRARLNLPAVEGFLIPHQAAIRTPDGGLVVYVVDNNNVIVPTPIQASRSVGNSWLVTTGLENGMRIVTEGFQKVRAKMTVSPVLAQNTSAVSD